MERSGAKRSEANVYAEQNVSFVMNGHALRLCVLGNYRHLAVAFHQAAASNCHVSPP
jgi:hypothetical protein